MNAVECDAAYLLMAGSTNQMQSRIDNGMVIACYSDGTSDTLRLHNPVNWPPIQEEYVFDDHAFWSCPVMPLRVRFDNGRVGRHINSPDLLPASLPSTKEGEQPLGSDNPHIIHHGAAVILKMALNPLKRVTTFRLVTLSNDVVVGIMGITMEKTEKEKGVR